MTGRSTFATRLWDVIASREDHPFWQEPGQRLSYGDLARALKTVSRHLAHRDLQPGETVLIVTDDDWTAFVTWLGAMLEGAVPTLLAADAGTPRVAAIAAALDPTVILRDDHRAGEDWATGADRTCLSPAEILAPPTAPLVAPSCRKGPEGLAYILYTSGSTSSPKGVMISHDNLEAQLDTIADAFRVDASSRIANGLVLYHTDGLTQGPLLSAWLGATVLRPPPFHPARLERDLDWLASAGATHMVVAPPILEFIERYAPRDDHFDRPDFVAILSSSARLAPDLWDRFERRFNVTLINEYGMTETVAASHFAGDLPGLGARHTIGVPLGCEARLVAPDGRIVERGEPGELVLKGPNIFVGYHGDPERTSAAFRDGWLRTGDLCRLRDDESYELVGRLATAFNVGGLLVQPEEIDEAALRHPDVDDARTVTIDSDIFWSVPVTAYVSDAGLTPADLMAHLRGSLEKLKTPKHVVRLDAIPRTGSGKPELPTLRKLVQAALERRPKATGDLAERVLALAADVFGVDPKSLSLDAAAEETPGWDSYAHTALMLEVEDAFGVEVPTADMMATATLGDLVAVVSRLAGTAMGSPSPYRIESIREGTGSGSLIVMPLVGGRSNYVLRLLAELPASVNVFGVSASRKEFSEDRDLSIPKLAEEVADAIRAAEIDGAIHLLGFSYGGYLAHEVAARLVAAQHPLDGLILIDTAVPLRFRRRFALLGTEIWAGRQRRRLRQLRSGGAWRLPDEDPTRWLHVPYIGRFDLSIHPPAHRDLIRRGFEAMAGYRPSRTALRTLLLPADWRRQYRTPTEDDLGWSRFNGGPIETTFVGQRHMSVVVDAQAARGAAGRIATFVESSMAAQRGGDS